MGILRLTLGFGYLMLEVFSTTQLIFLYLLAWILNTTFFFLRLAQVSILFNSTLIKNAVPQRIKATLKVTLLGCQSFCIFIVLSHQPANRVKLRATVPAY